MSFLLYGAYGYTGELIARRAKQEGLNPILAGRDPQKTEALARELGFEFRVFSLGETEKLEAALLETSFVLHAAGPFIHTAKPMMKACIRTGRHYLDITGEIAVFKMAHDHSTLAAEKGIMLMPGVGFDVVPTDCLAAMLKSGLPEATHLKLAFATLGSRPSRGTALTMVENLGEKGAVRKDGRLVRVPVAHKTLRFPAGEKELFAMTIPWGDVFTAYFTTGIPNIEVYMGVPRSLYRQAQWSRYLGWLLKTDFIRNMARKRIYGGPSGPNEQQRNSTISHLWGEVKSPDGKRLQAVVVTPEGYSLTAETSVHISRKLLEGNFKTGFQTPAAVYGSDLILAVPGVVYKQI